MAVSWTSVEDHDQECTHCTGSTHCQKLVRWIFQVHSHNDDLDCDVHFVFLVESMWLVDDMSNSGCQNKTLLSSQECKVDLLSIVDSQALPLIWAFHLDIVAQHLRRGRTER